MDNPPTRHQIKELAREAIQAGMVILPDYTEAQLEEFLEEVADGKHRRMPGIPSPEGYFLHEERWIQEVEKYWWWDGIDYRELEIAGQVDLQEALPGGPRPFGEVWKVREHVAATNEYVYVPWYWDSEAGIWRKMRRFWDVEGQDALPYPAVKIGAYHLVKEPDVKVYWDGYAIRRLPHRMLDLGENDTKHLPDGFLQSLPADARVVYGSATEIGIEAVEGGSGNVFVRDQVVEARKDASVFNYLPVLEWDSQSGAIVGTHIEPQTEYWIYLAADDPAFAVAGLPADGDKPVTPAWDFRRKLFLSRSQPVNWYLSDSGAGVRARLVGKIETDGTGYAAGGPLFRREIDISLLNQQVPLPETYRDYSDLVLKFGDHETLQLRRLDGLYGAMAVARALYYLGTGRTVSISDPWIEYDPDAPNPEDRLIRRTDPLEASSQYFIYISSDAMAWNFNATNPETGLPWTAEDEEATGNYNADLDMRLRLFLCVTAPDHGLLDEEWPASESRLVGKVRTDENGRFVPDHDISAIRQPVLPQSSFDSLADLEIVPIDATEFRLCRKKAGSGAVNVGGQIVRSYEEDDLANVHRCRTTDVVQAYTEANLSAPLSDLNSVSSYAGGEIYLYLANGREHWGALANRHFFSTSAPQSGYLSRNWPGNQARWICTVKPDDAGQFTGKYIAQTIAISSHSQLFDDEPEKHRVQSDALVTPETLLSGWAVIWQTQCLSGVAGKLEYVDASHVILKRIGLGMVAVPDGTARQIPVEGMSLEVSGAAGQVYYVYLGSSTLVLSTEAPDEDHGGCQTHQNDVLVGYVGFCASGLGGTWSVFSWSHEPAAEWSEAVTDKSTTISLPGLIVPPGRKAILERRGLSTVKRAATATEPNIIVIFLVTDEYGHQQLQLTHGLYVLAGQIDVTVVPGLEITATVVDEVSLTYADNWTNAYYTWWGGPSWYHHGNLTLKRDGSQY